MNFKKILSKINIYLQINLIYFFNLIIFSAKYLILNNLFENKAANYIINNYKSIIYKYIFMLFIYFSVILIYSHF